MRAIRAASAALLGAAALALTAPTAAFAVNNTPYDFRVTPSTVAPGGRVTLTAGGCPSTTTVTSGVFDVVTVPQNGAATAVVDQDATPGAVYSVQFNCIGRIGTLDLRISGGTSTPTVSSTTTIAPSGVGGGLGGSFEAMNTTEIVAGGVLVAAAATATVLVVRRRAAHRRH
ncbi:hypothetical protein HW130_00480 [Streptomyces sp. PKU-EA00015]|uniref:hypothetical protein n=1 Tax=Streptomyces sp. PKU-EA00015 TaxID=2748326 RepID=UPI0015A2C341|nr:hypothetical protein [Streptomyces sp. PKU-EA00015]NWF24757.1 hypothetical protein [Streptomyces sp. PKU-EA00015]